MNVREELEKREELFLSSFATLSKNSKGRAQPEAECPVRTCFQRDRDRIIHSKAFRRLIHKTQVFFSPEGDHYRTRLTHTLEVSQIARTIARALFLNEDLTEAIALGHDLGHTPFGHAGEDVLDRIMRSRFGLGFRHNEQSVRVVSVIENNGKGLNLTYEVIDGIRNHGEEGNPSTLEGQVVRISDWIAYINHDIDDAIRGQVISEDDLPEHEIKVLGLHHRDRINTLVTDVIRNTWNKAELSMSDEVYEAMFNLRQFLFERVYMESKAKVEEKKAPKILSDLFDYFIEHPSELPVEFSPKNESELPVKVCDYLAGMTDRYALSKYSEIFIPKTWSIK